MKLRIRAEARSDLDAILDYSVVKHGAATAEAYMRSIGAAFDRLLDHPEAGIDRSDLSPDVRSYPVGQHRIYYRLSEDRLSIARVLHKAMDPSRHV